MTHANLDDQGNGVVRAETGEQDVDEPDFAAIGAKNARENGQQGDLDRQCHWAIEDGSDVAEFLELNLVVVTQVTKVIATAIFSHCRLMVLAHGVGYDVYRLELEHRGW